MQTYDGYVNDGVHCRHTNLFEVERGHVDHLEEVLESREGNNYVGLSKCDFDGKRFNSSSILSIMNISWRVQLSESS